MPARRGRQEPTYKQVGEYSQTDGPQAAKLASEFWDEPLRWQRNLINVMLARDGFDKYRFHTIAISVPRQNGKSWIVRARCFYGLVADGEKILYTCQHGDTADEMFKALSAPFEDEDNEELNGLLKAVRKTNGQQAIYLKNGGYIRFTTRTKNLARGKSYDCIVYDECQCLTSAQQAASLPTMSASAKHNTQVIYLGTPPGPEIEGTVFRGIHDRVHDGKAPEIAYLEWAADEIGDVHDKSRWYDTNPSLGYLIDEVAVQTECDNMDDDEFARERLGWWVQGGHFNSAIDPVAWDACATEEPPQEGKTSFAVKFDVEGRNASIAFSANDGGKPHVELVGCRMMPDSLGSIARFLSERSDEAACIVIDGKAYSGALYNELISLEVPERMVVIPTAKDVCTAAQMLVSKVTAHEVTHFAQDDLTEYAKGCSKRVIGRDGSWGIGDGTAPGYPVEACSLALWGNETTRRDPNGGISVW